MDSAASYANHEVIQQFVKFLQIKSISFAGPEGAYWECVRLLESIAKGIGLQTSIVEPIANKPILLCTWLGSQPKLPSILLNSHYDVVPVDHPKWTMGDPFGGSILANGDILARGTQDMKSVCIQYLAAIQRLWKLRSGKGFKRTIHLSFVPDEEIGGQEGMIELLRTSIFNKLNVGLALDEGLANETNKFSVYYGQRAVWWLVVKAKGPAGHGSRLIENTAMEKLIRSINQFLAFRHEQTLKIRPHNCKDKPAKLGDVVTINLTALKGGHSPDGGKSWAMNVIPTEVLAGFDIRIPPSVNLVEFEALVKEWTKEDGVEYSFQYSQHKHSVTSIDSGSEPWWSVFKKSCENLGMELDPEIFPAGTDSAYIRHLGIPAFGFSPMNNTPILLHDHNERLNASTFLKGIDIYEGLIPSLANDTNNNNPKPRLSTLPAKI